MSSIPPDMPHGFVRDDARGILEQYRSSRDRSGVDPTWQPHTRNAYLVKLNRNIPAMNPSTLEVGKLAWDDVNDNFRFWEMDLDADPPTLKQSTAEGFDLFSFSHGVIVGDQMHWAEQDIKGHFWVKPRGRLQGVVTATIVAASGSAPGSGFFQPQHANPITKQFEAIPVADPQPVEVYNWCEEAIEVGQRIWATTDNNGLWYVTGECCEDQNFISWQGDWSPSGVP